MLTNLRVFVPSSSWTIYRPIRILASRRRHGAVSLLIRAICDYRIQKHRIGGETVLIDNWRSASLAPFHSHIMHPLRSVFPEAYLKPGLHSTLHNWLLIRDQDSGAYNNSLHWTVPCQPTSLRL